VQVPGQIRLLLPGQGLWLIPLQVQVQVLQQELRQIPIQSLQ